MMLSDFFKKRVQTLLPSEDTLRRALHFLDKTLVRKVNPLLSSYKPGFHFKHRRFLHNSQTMCERITGIRTAFFDAVLATDAFLSAKEIKKVDLKTLYE